MPGVLFYTFPDQISLGSPLSTNREWSDHMTLNSICIIMAMANNTVLIKIITCIYGLCCFYLNHLVLQFILSSPLFLYCSCLFCSVTKQRKSLCSLVTDARGCKALKLLQCCFRSPGLADNVLCTNYIKNCAL